MRRAWIEGAATVAAFLLLAAAAPAVADEASGRWKVAGRVPGFEFTLNCLFQQSGVDLTGLCVDGATSDPKVKGGRGHRLTRGHVSGDQVVWAYDSSFLLSRFTVEYAGVRRGDHMSGKITVQGRTGTFNADRLAA